MNEFTTIATAAVLLTVSILVWWIVRRHARRDLATLDRAIADALREMRNSVHAIPAGEWSLVTARRWFGRWTVMVQVGTDSILVMKFDRDGPDQFRFVEADVAGKTQRPS